MASIYLQRKSKFFWLKFKDAHGAIKRFSTKLSRTNPVDVRRASQLEAEYTLKERSYAALPDAGSWIWVEPFLNTTYKAKPSTLHRYLGIWRNLRMFIQEREIETPAQFSREHCFAYMQWRAEPDKKKGKFRACHNTALLELKTLRIIMNEAVIRGLCPGNPCVKLKIKKEAVAQCPELTNEQCDLIRATIATVKDDQLREFYEISFELGRWQGCRISATRVNPQTDVVMKGQQGTIRFVSKGKDFVTMLHPRLFPLFKRLRKAGRTATWNVPAGARRTWPSLQWTNLLDHSGLKKNIPGICFRSLRVTVATRMARNNVPISKAKEFLKHASTTVHFVYQRLTPEDLGDCAAALE